MSGARQLISSADFLLRSTLDPVDSTISFEDVALKIAEFDDVAAMRATLNVFSGLDWVRGDEVESGIYGLGSEGSLGPVGGPMRF